MSFVGFLILILVVLLIVSMFVSFYDGLDCSEIVTTTTTCGEANDSPNLVGNLKRHFTEGDRPQAFVIDPVDGEKTFLNSNDDMYEDADGRVWRLV